MFYFLFFIFLLLRSPRRPTAANNGQRRPTKANEGQRRPTKAHSSQRRPTTANEGQRRPTQVNEGPQQPRRPTQAHEDQKGPKRRVWRRLGRFVGMSPRQPAAPHLPHPSLARTRPTKAHEGPQQPRRPTQAHEEEKGPKRRVWRRLGPRCVFLNYFSAFY